MSKKRITMHEAASMVKSGDTLALGGLTLYRRPVSFVRNLLIRFFESGEPSNLTLLPFAAGFESDLLVGAGMVSHIRSCYFGLEIFGLAPMFTYYATRGEIDVIEETEASLALGLRAQIAGIGFMPSRAWIGTDLFKLRPDVRTIIDPYNGQELVAFPAIKPDIAVIHALTVDEDGNSIIGKNKSVDGELALSADKVLITAEQEVPELEQVDIIGPLVQAYIVSPGGALPSSCHPFYPMDGNAIMNYTETVSNPENFKKFIEKWLNKE